ncbi:ABC transporter permease [Ahrensia sp. R2A130]|uniref:ABC transporter permease n=1 Tax=Ahrensia sp. R2A130 TaxID=744979 RepID=UPI0001E0E913|nr:ABC transporter permease [Ahrensia sp. R2A130]EFL87482.1 ABC efflux transporter, permease protein [Ahrensia sp. R2A130]
MSKLRLLLRLVVASLWSRRLAVLFVVLAVSVSTVLYLSVERLRVGAWQSFSSTVSGTDLIVGARSGGVQLMLYSVFRIGNATNNITMQSVRDIQTIADVAWTVPLSLGDSYRGYRVVGTNDAYFERYRYGRDRKLELAQGAAFGDLFDVVLGSEVADALNYVIGDRVVVAHGLGRAGLVTHDDLPFTVSGILAPTGTPVDRSLHVSLPAITAIHVDWSTGARARNTTPADVLRQRAAAGELEAEAITALLVGMKSKLSVFRTARAINDYRQEPLLAVLPGVALQELWGVIGTAERALSAVAFMVVLTSIIGLVATILATLEQRRREIAILRSLGARPLVISGLLVAESALVTLAGLVLGVLIVTIATPLAAGWLRANYGLDLPLTLSSGDIAVLAAILASSIVAALLPAWRAYRMSLGEGLGATT